MIQALPHVRWIRVLVLASAFAGLASAVALLPFARDSARSIIASMCRDSVEPTLASNDDFAAIVLAIVSASRDLGAVPPPPDAMGRVARNGRRPVLLSDASIIICPGKPQLFGQVVISECPSILNDELLNWSGADPRISQDMRMQLARANRAPVAVPALERWLVRTVTDESIQAATAAGGRDWPDFYATFPDTAGYIRVSQPVLTPDRAWAAIAVEYHCGNLCGYGGVYLLMRDQMGWKVVLSDGLWVS